jgi:hypothetical protein
MGSLARENGLTYGEPLAEMRKNSNGYHFIENTGGWKTSDRWACPKYFAEYRRKWL